MLVLSQWATPCQLEIITSRLTSRGELMTHACCGATRQSHKARDTVVVYCFNISETVTFTKNVSKSLIMYNCYRKYWRWIASNHRVKGHKVNMFYRENCLFSPRALVRGIPVGGEFASENINTLGMQHIDVIMSAMASQITSLTIIYSSFYSGVDQRKHHSSVSLAFVRGIHRWPVNSPHKGQ